MRQKSGPIGKIDEKPSKIRKDSLAGKKATSPTGKAKTDSKKISNVIAAAPLVATNGAQPQAQTIVYIHGIGNKPPAATLKCQWDKALFGLELGDRSRLAYWVNREFYPNPTDDTCTSADIVRVDDDEMSTKAVLSLSKRSPAEDKEVVAAEIASLSANKDECKILSAIADKMEISVSEQEDAYKALDVEAKILPLPRFMRRIITQITTRAFMRDVHEFFFENQRREAMEKSLLDRLETGGGPFVVIGHSQGSMIAYNVLRRLAKKDCNVILFITIGSPLGVSEVRDVLGKWNDKDFRVPACVTRWVNVADPLDPVAADKMLTNEYAIGNGQSLQDYLVINPDSPRHPHSGTGYLRTSEVRDELLRVVGNSFAQPVAKSIIAKDLVQQIENGYRTERHPTLIQLSTSNIDDSVEQVGRRLVTALTSMIKDSSFINDSETELKRANIDPLKRYISAHLTRSEIEQLRTRYNDLRIERVWRNAEKMALVSESANTIQCAPAVAGYGATGRDIGWAVLDTGIRAEHPHFKLHNNIKGQWDCTKSGAPIACKPGSIECNTLDRQGHGTHVAGIIAGEYSFSATDSEKPARFAGMAPETSLYGFKVLDDRGNGRDAWIIKALDAIADINDEHAGHLMIAGINLSLGGAFDPSVYGCGHSPICQELRRLWGQGVLICLAAGNEGYVLLQAANGEIPSNMDLSIGDPANLDEAIAVGSIHKTNPHTYGVSYFSSRGPTADGRSKPDLVAPGERILSALHDIRRNGNGVVVSDLYVEMSGTSMAAPHVSGLLAGFLSARREFVGYPTRVKEILLAHCTTLNRDRYVQGAGMPNSIRMLSNT
jgi:subtilisin family serine protease